MRLLLDTHALLWWALDDPNLSRTAYAAIADPSATVHVSTVSAFELATKHRLGKLAVADPLLANLDRYLSEQGFIALPSTLPARNAPAGSPAPIATHSTAC